MKIVRAKTPAQWGDVLMLQLKALPLDEPCEMTGAWWIAYEGDQPAGFAGVVPSSRWRDAMYLCRCGVLPAFRGKGLQKRLLMVRENYARKQGMRWLITDTTENPASANSLIARGFRLFTPAKPWSYKHSLYWRKPL